VRRLSRQPWLAPALLLPVLGCSAADARPPAQQKPAAPAAPIAPQRAQAPAGPADFVVAGQLTQGGAVEITLAGANVPFAADGTFFAAFDRDAPPTAVLVAKLASGRIVTRLLTVAPRAWKIENVNIARRAGGPTDDFMAVRGPELARIAAARKLSSDSQGWRQPFVWPAKGRISGVFGSQRVYRGEPGAYHSGTDIATGAAGTPFVAPADGVVILAAYVPFSLEGKLLMIDHGMGLNSAFLHCSELLVKEGDHVRQGQTIGRIGATGRATGPHLHWSIKWRDARLDPILFTGPMR
jgi:murein DD-endopeptidase MepM/ murein hydrolase activator NlpD